MYRSWEGLSIGANASVGKWGFWILNIITRKTTGRIWKPELLNHLGYMSSKSIVLESNCLGYETFARISFVKFNIILHKSRSIRGNWDEHNIETFYQ